MIYRSGGKIFSSNNTKQSESSMRITHGLMASPRKLNIRISAVCKGMFINYVTERRKSKYLFVILVSFVQSDRSMISA